ncbi:MAG: hypothetical protein SNJ77_06090 [Cytophagales bacterium]
MMGELEIFLLLYKSRERKIGIVGKLNAETKKKLRNCGDLRFSKTHGVWYLPYAKEVYSKLKSQFPQLVVSTRNETTQTEQTIAQKTAIASPSEEAKTIKVEAKKSFEQDTGLRIVADENKGWMVKCDFKKGMMLKTGVSKAVWIKHKKMWFVPAKKGNFEKLKTLFNIPVPLLMIENSSVEKRALLKKHPESDEHLLVEIPFLAHAYHIIKTTPGRYYEKGRKCWRIVNKTSVKEQLIERLKSVGVEPKLKNRLLL